MWTAFALSETKDEESEKMSCTSISLSSMYVLFAIFFPEFNMIKAETLAYYFFIIINN